MVLDLLNLKRTMQIANFRELGEFVSGFWSSFSCFFAGLCCANVWASGYVLRAVKLFCANICEVLKNL